MKALSYLASLTLLMLLPGCRKGEEAPPHEPRPPASTQPLVQPSPAAPTADNTKRSPLSPRLGDEPPEILEARYLEQNRIADKLRLLDAISDGDAVPAVQSLGRLFQLEPDIQLKEEILNALTYVDEVEDDKLALLASAAQPNQPKSVRHAAIKLMIEEGNPQAITALQALVTDADPEIREDAVFAIEELQTGE